MLQKDTVHYVSCHGAQLFTVVCLPEPEGKFPTVIIRTPYVDNEEKMDEKTLCGNKRGEYAPWLNAGYAVVFQHCRGRGKSSGDCVPYIYEREDGLFLQEWIRHQPFYNGELFLQGGSYSASVHFTTAPFAPDIKGAVLSSQDCRRYNCNYRNGFYKMGLHGGWYVGMYKKKSGLNKCFVPDSYKMLPLSDFSRAVLGEPAADFDGILAHPHPDDPFWTTRYGGGEARNAIQNANIPILLMTGLYDIYTGGVFDMWRELDQQTRSLCALAVHPFGHSLLRDTQPIPFENGDPNREFPDFRVRWLDAVRGKCPPPFTPGKVTYYTPFDGKWRCDDFYNADSRLRLSLGEGEVTYRYNPYAPATFKGGLSANFGANAWQDPPNSRYDIISLYTQPFARDTFLKGKIAAALRVRSDCEDTCFYMRLSLCKEEGDYGLRDDIQQISNFRPDYRPHEELEIAFSFDEHSILLKKGERLRVDISSSAFPHYVPHTNCRGLFSAQTTAKVATNTVILDGSYLELPVWQPL